MQDVLSASGEDEQARREIISIQVSQRRWIMLAGYCVPFIVPACLAFIVFAA
jgi:hypothetical protein